MVPECSNAPIKAERQGRGGWAGVRHDALPQSHTQIHPRVPLRTRGWWWVVRYAVCVLTISTVCLRTAHVPERHESRSERWMRWSDGRGLRVVG
jgi:hypothetical protein